MYKFLFKLFIPTFKDLCLYSFITLDIVFTLILRSVKNLEHLSFIKYLLLTKLHTFIHILNPFLYFYRRFKYLYFAVEFILPNPTYLFVFSFAFKSILTNFIADVLDFYNTILNRFIYYFFFCIKNLLMNLNPSIFLSYYDLRTRLINP